MGFELKTRIFIAFFFIDHFESLFHFLLKWLMSNRLESVYTRHEIQWHTRSEYYHASAPRWFDFLFIWPWNENHSIDRWNGTNRCCVRYQNKTKMYWKQFFRRLIYGCFMSRNFLRKYREKNSVPFGCGFHWCVKATTKIFHLFIDVVAIYFPLVWCGLVVSSLEIHMNVSNKLIII